MKSALIAVLFCICVPFTFAGDFHSESFTAPLPDINVAAHRFLRIRNFTQDGTGARGAVKVTVGTSPATTVLSAAIITTGAAVPETINSIVIAGPATVTITAGVGGTTFITYTKEHESD
jgi:hypothetical protein